MDDGGVQASAISGSSRNLILLSGREPQHLPRARKTLLALSRKISRCPERGWLVPQKRELEERKVFESWRTHRSGCGKRSRVDPGTLVEGLSSVLFERGKRVAAKP